MRIIQIISIFNIIQQYQIYTNSSYFYFPIIPCSTQPTHKCQNPETTPLMQNIWPWINFIIYIHKSKHIILLPHRCTIPYTWTSSLRNQHHSRAQSLIINHWIRTCVRNRNSTSSKWPVNNSPMIKWKYSSPKIYSLCFWPQCQPILYHRHMCNKWSNICRKIWLFLKHCILNPRPQLSVGIFFRVSNKQILVIGYSTIY